MPTEYLSRGSVLYSNTIGTTILRIGNGRYITLEDTLLVPMLGRLVTVLKHLLSTSFEIFETIYSPFLASASTRGRLLLESINTIRS